MRLLRRLLAAACCHFDVHDVPKGYRRIAPSEHRHNAPTWTVRCRWCPERFVVQPEAHLEESLAGARGMRW